MNRVYQGSATFLISPYFFSIFQPEAALIKKIFAYNAKILLQLKIII